MTTGGYTLEQALARTEADATNTLKAAKTLVGVLRKLESAAREGRLRDIRVSIEGAEKALGTLAQQFANAKDGWRFEEEPYLADGRYSKELMAAGEKVGLKLFERDERLYCYPALLRVSGMDRAVFIDKKRETRIRPGVLVGILRDVQKRPARLRPEAFLPVLFDAYEKIGAMRQKEFFESPIPLLDIYDLLTPLPGHSRDYPRQDFARDIYLLHKSGFHTTKGATISFPSSTGTKTPSRTLTYITETGEEKRYYDISFTRPHRSGNP